MAARASRSENIMGWPGFLVITSMFVRISDGVSNYGRGLGTGYFLLDWGQLSEMAKYKHFRGSATTLSRQQDPQDSCLAGRI